MIQNYAKKMTSCKFDVYHPQPLENVSCDKEAFGEYIELLISIKQSRIIQLQEETGCYPKCKVVQYFHEIGESDLNWAANWTAEVFIQPKSSMVEKTHEYYRCGQTIWYTASNKSIVYSALHLGQV